MLVSGVVSTGLLLVIIKFTKLGVYAVAGVSVFVNLIRNMMFTVPVTAKYLGYKWNKFYPQVLITIASSLGLLVVYHFIAMILPGSSWLELIFSAGVLGIIGLIINVFIILSKSERKFLFNKFAGKLHLKSRK